MDFNELAEKHRDMEKLRRKRKEAKKRILSFLYLFCDALFTLCNDLIIINPSVGCLIYGALLHTCRSERAKENGEEKAKTSLVEIIGKQKANDSKILLASSPVLYL